MRQWIGHVPQDHAVDVVIDTLGNRLGVATSWKSTARQHIEMFRKKKKVIIDKMKCRNEIYSELE